MKTTLGCMRAYLSRVIFAGLLGGIALGGATLLGAGLVSAGDTTSPLTSETSATEDPAPNATYDETQPGADDPHVKEGFAAYKSGDFKQAYDIWLPLAEAGNAEAQFRVGRLYQKGEGQTKNIDTALSWYLRATASQHTRAMNSIGVIYEIGDGVDKKISMAMTYYYIAAEKCQISAQFNLGQLYFRLPEQKRDVIHGHMWLEIAAARGHELARKVSTRLREILTKDEEFFRAKQKAQEWLYTHPCA